LNWQPVVTGFSAFKVWSGVTLNDYTFKEYTKDNTTFNGNEVTGVPGRVLTGGVDFEISKHFMRTLRPTIPLRFRWMMPTQPLRIHTRY
jgi:hypothetical protein